MIILNNIFNRQFETIGLSIFAILYNQPYSYFDEIELTQEELEKFVNEYQVNTNYKVKITRTGDQLFIQRNGLPGVELFAYKANIFFQKDDDIRVSFQNENGSIKKITITERLSTKKGVRFTDNIKLMAVLKRFYHLFFCW